MSTYKSEADDKPNIDLNRAEKLLFRRQFNEVRSMFRRALATASYGLWLICLAYNSPVVAQNSSSVYGGGGRIGPTGKATDIVQDHNRSGKSMRIEGTCQSSCTMLLAIKNVCVDPNATLLFHAALLRPDQKLNPQKQAAMLRAYNPKLRNYLVANHYVDTFEFHSISGRRIIDEFGYRACN